ncbi:MAG: hypothetical protein GF344_14765 [Chitinivibrionales bacterium]|nr:hypothetical protein [Chitinivibrionales bacterium]MBD3357974.1 hypothetical protein [Chitinivibrionales bacterium]
MKTADFIETHFEDAYAIHEICAQMRYPRRIARLCTYIHVKLIENDEHYFERPQPEDEAAIGVLLGKESLEELTDPHLVEITHSPIYTVARKLKKVETMAEKEYGLEYYITSELTARLQLHTDTAFRERMLHLYRNKIRAALEDRRLSD